ncbi:ankyrin repeat domain protein [Leptospira noguchii serovar Panama str. CZ214]|uniref:Ankyrin repeat domain protein n=1 Tax=Leptospira noguchii serovar Panama str. CZ214 TaxID=1001595 RepID=T0FW32_9LEPT|nr:ankyrin repeat domain-containing protein [Leptospira noguchii]EQA73740.1 ankyrin repeat domain protein [Leptospira noguchii serovar Panama str. CZ214]
MNPLHHCINEGKLESLQFLLEKGADPTIQDKYGKTYLM